MLTHTFIITVFCCRIFWAELLIDLYNFEDFWPDPICRFLARVNFIEKESRLTTTAPFAPVWNGTDDRRVNFELAGHFEGARKQECFEFISESVLLHFDPKCGQLYRPNVQPKWVYPIRFRWKYFLTKICSVTTTYMELVLYFNCMYTLTRKKD